MEKQLGGFCRNVVSSYPGCLIPASCSFPPFKAEVPQFQVPNMGFFARQPPNGYKLSRGTNSQDTHCSLQYGRSNVHGCGRLKCPPRFMVTGGWVLKGDP